MVLSRDSIIEHLIAKDINLFSLKEHFFPTTSTSHNSFVELLLYKYRNNLEVNTKINNK